ncbi:hypothetical protein [uncultured Sphingomonas sp.]|uniref:hypothetical protein n=1 Tax=uncultured Sphingomonas sp. TaxID=158754 RepID=UPI0035CC8F3A
MLHRIVAAFAIVVVATPLGATTPRENLVQVAFYPQDRTQALVAIGQIEADTRATLQRAPGDREARMVNAMATSYRAKLANNRADAIAARSMFEALVASNPRDPEAQVALGGWHVSSVVALGGLIARGALGARKSTGLEALDAAVRLGGGRAAFSAIAGLLRLQLDGGDPRAAQLIEAGACGATPTMLDRLMQRNAQRMAAILKRGDKAQIRRAASQLMPLGQLNA